VDVSDELIELLRREIVAMELVEARLRALELLAAADEHRFLTVALDELDVAAERLAALEVGRTLSVMSTGFTPDVTASRLADSLQGEEGERLRAVVEGLRVAAERLTLARDRARAVVAGGREAIAARLDASGILAGA
jgi:hypothetical protein